MLFTKVLFTIVEVSVELAPLVLNQAALPELPAPVELSSAILPLNN